MTRASRFVITAALPALLLLAWEAASHLGWLQPLFFPPPSQIWLRFLDLLSSGPLLDQFRVTIQRVFGGVLIGGAIGTMLGLLMGRRPALDVMLDGTVSSLHPLPKIALLRLFLVVMGFGEPTWMLLISLSSFFPMLFAARTAMRGIDPLLLDVARNYGLRGGLALRRVLLPACLPVLLAGLRLAVGTALIVTISIEMLAAPNGLGTVLWSGWQTLRVADIYVVLALIGGIGFLLAAAIRKLEKHAL